MALDELVFRADALFHIASPYLNALVLALAILFTGIIIARICDLLLRSLFSEIRFDDVCANILRSRRNYSRALRKLIVYAIYVCTAYLLLNVLGILQIIARSILVLFVIVLVLSLLFFLVDLLPHLLAKRTLRRLGVAQGVSVVITDEFGETRGIIARVGLTSVSIERESGELLWYPANALARSRIRFES